MNKRTLTRKQLYDLVWSEPILAIAKKYNISDAILRDVCKKFEIPIPQSGHWTKVKFNKSVEILKLAGNSKTIINLEEEESKSPQIQIRKIQKEIEKSGLDLTVPERLNTSEKIILDAKDFLSGKKYGYQDRVNTYDHRLNISVSGKNVLRALSFMDTFIKLLKARGHQIELKYSKNYVMVFDERIEIGLREKQNMKMVQKQFSWKQAEYTLTGLLVFKMVAHYSYHKEWIDGEIPIEKQLSKILATIEYKAALDRLEGIEWRKKQAEVDKQRKAKEQVRMRKQEELENFQALLTTSKRWFKSKSLREYIDEVERKAILSNTLSDELTTWLKWARKKVDWYDPTIESEDEMLKEVDKTNLKFLSQRDYWDTD